MTIIIDSLMSFDEAMRGSAAPDEIRKTLELVDVLYVSFDGRDHLGQLLVHRELVPDVQKIFAEIHLIRFPILMAIPVVKYNWDDEASMKANNSSAFNYRPRPNSDVISLHGRGCALDLNPLLNPYLRKDGTVLPAGATYDPSVPGTIMADSQVVRIFKELNWEWGGDWDEPIDYQHFEKLL